MSDILTTYQAEQEQLGRRDPSQFALATVTGVSSSGLALRFDGETAASTKRFPRNVAISFSVGQRVLMVKVNGNYIALCPVGL